MHLDGEPIGRTPFEFTLDRDTGRWFAVSEAPAFELALSGVSNQSPNAQTSSGD